MPKVKLDFFFFFFFFLTNWFVQMIFFFFSPSLTSQTLQIDQRFRTRETRVNFKNKYSSNLNYYLCSLIGAIASLNCLDNGVVFVMESKIFGFVFFERRFVYFICESICLILFMRTCIRNEIVQIYLAIA